MLIVCDYVCVCVVLCVKIMVVCACMQGTITRHENTVLIYKVLGGLQKHTTHINMVHVYMCLNI